ncbi:MAG: hypothetical protein AB7E79_09160 [Rhodospirillaceae bacterium]
MRFILFLLTCLASVALARGAAASAVYAWVPVDPTGCCRGILELSDDAYRAGVASFTPDMSPDLNPVARFHFEGRFKVADLQPIAAGPEQEVELNVMARPGLPGCCAWEIQLQIDGKQLKGRLRVTAPNDDVILSSSGNGWRIERAGSDAVSSGVICGSGAAHPCNGDRGQWVLVTAPGGVQKTGQAREGDGSPGTFPLR